MSRLLTNPEMVALQEDTDYLNAGIPIWGSRVLIWAQANNMPVLIYNSPVVGYVTSDISDLGQSLINQLAQQSEVHGMWYYLPQSVEEVVSDDAEKAIQAAKDAGMSATNIMQYVAEALGNTINKLIQPLVSTLMIPLVIGIAIGLVYLAKKG